MPTFEQVANGKEPALADATHWVRLDILVVANEAVFRSSAVTALRACGHRVRVVGNYSCAIAALGDDLPDLIVADRSAAAFSLASAIMDLVEQGVPLVPFDRVRAAIENHREEDLFQPFCLGQLS